ncbi:hypothetical protein BDW27_12434 [Nocardiopsis sp. L17-MgMaSL7]|nr:hypothetical protein BDW27_12434 [Nocardiopsis sp. L17-MgMaSL7]
MNLRGAPGKPVGKPASLKGGTPRLFALNPSRTDTVGDRVPVLERYGSLDVHPLYAPSSGARMPGWQIRSGVPVTGAERLLVRCCALGR